MRREAEVVRPWAKMGLEFLEKQRGKSGRCHAGAMLERTAGAIATTAVQYRATVFKLNLVHAKLALKLNILKL